MMHGGITQCGWIYIVWIFRPRSVWFRRCFGRAESGWILHAWLRGDRRPSPERVVGEGDLEFARAPQQTWEEYEIHRRMAIRSSLATMGYLSALPGRRGCDQGWRETQEVAVQALRKRSAY